MKRTSDLDHRCTALCKKTELQCKRKKCHERATDGRIVCQSHHDSKQFVRSLTNLSNDVLSYIGEYLPETEFLKYQRTSRRIHAANEQQTHERMSKQTKMPHGNCAPLPEWTRILKDLNLFYFVPTFPEILLKELDEERFRGQPDMALAYALYLVEPDAGSYVYIEADIVDLKKAYQDRDLDSLTYYAHKLVARATTKHRKMMLKELFKLNKVLPYDLHNMYRYGMEGKEVHDNNVCTGHGNDY
jgi:hypothetical protein